MEVDNSCSLNANQIIQKLEEPGINLLPVKMELKRKANIRELINALMISKKIQTSRILCDILGERRAKSAIPVLIKCLNSRSEDLRENAAEAIGKIGGEEAGEELINQLRKKPNVWIAIALGAIKYKPSIPYLIIALTGPFPKVRGGAAWSLGEFMAKEALGELEKAFEKETDSYSKKRISVAIEIIRNT
jgi:HEAT repeat protein